MGLSIIISAVVAKLNIVFGVLFCLFVIFFTIVSIPVYLYRLVIIFLAKHLRPDLGDILNGQSAIFVNDYFNKKPPRSCAVLALYFEGKLTVDELKARASRTWLTARDSRGNLIYDKFQQYPVHWMGFTFWKYCGNFNIDEHVHQLNATGKATDDEVTEAIERHINLRLPEKKSPWEIYVVENYKTSRFPGNCHRSILLFKVHHCLVDGNGIFTALCDGLFERYTFRKMARAVPQLPRRSWKQFVIHLVSMPVNIVTEMSVILGQSFKKSPLKVPDQDKSWHHVFNNSLETIPVNLIKDIKNTFGVSYTSVLLSATAGAVHKIIGDIKKTRNISGDEDNAFCLSMLPARSDANRKVLANHMTGALFDLPIRKFQNPLKRLDAVEKMLERNKNSVVPMLTEYVSTLCGAHLRWVNKILAKNRMISMSLSNFAGVPMDIEMADGLKWTFTEAGCGCADGDTGLFIVSMSHSGQIGIQVIAEEALLTKEQCKLLTSLILDELHGLEKLMLEHLKWKKCL